VPSSLGKLERAVLEVLWDRDKPSLVREVVRALVDRELAYTTVMTVLDRLEKKGVVRRERDGRAWRYEPTTTREGYAAQLMLEALDLAGNRGDALTRFAEEFPVSAPAPLSRALDDRRAGGRPE
jgi:predicted transcriptional regulator